MITEHDLSNKKIEIIVDRYSKFVRIISPTVKSNPTYTCHSIKMNNININLKDLYNDYKNRKVYTLEFANAKLVIDDNVNAYKNTLIIVPTSDKTSFVRSEKKADVYKTTYTLKFLMDGKKVTQKTVRTTRKNTEYGQKVEEINEILCDLQFYELRITKDEKTLQKLEKLLNNKKLRTLVCSESREVKLRRLMEDENLNN